MSLTLAQRVKMLEEMAADEGLKATQRLRALEELGRIEARAQLASGAAASDVPEGEMAPDPMADLDEMEIARQRKAARRGRTAG